MAKIIKYFKNTEKPFRWEWILFIIICVLIIPNNYYNDIIETSHHSINLLQCIFSGEFLKFYQISGAAYALPIYIIFAIWNLPVFLIKVIFNIDPMSSWLIVPYEKALLILFFWFSIRIFENICEEIGYNQKQTNWAKYLYVTSAIVMYTLIVIGQYDIFSVVIAMLGVLAYLKKDWKKFILWFAIATTFKFFSLIVFFALLLLAEKKVWKIICNTLIVLLPILLFSKSGLLFRWSAVKTASPTLEKSLFTMWIYKGSFSLGVHSISILMFAMILLYLYCYVKRIDGDEQFKQYTIYICALAYSIFLFVAPTYPYWQILATPYIVLLIFSNKEQFKTNVLLETVGMSSLVFLYQNITYTWCTGYRTFLPTFWSNIIALPANGESLYQTGLLAVIAQIIGHSGIISVMQFLLSSFYIAALVVFFIINSPKTVHNLKSDKIEIERGVILFRTFCTVLLGFLPIIIFLYNVNFVF